MKILVINGPNINLIGIREPEIYGNKNYKDLCNLLQNKANEIGVQIEIFQSNHEGSIIDKIQEAYGVFDGIIINPAAFTHTSVAIADALTAVNIPYAEVHISDVFSREDFRKISYIRDKAVKTVFGKGFNGYTECLEYLVGELKC
ncbi:MAG: type II 3-dehydroquinate dehydratase [Clostridia bacterium]|nr:type II 3-dehydroquinate dehydratase [Clostridia bacterium]